jgi:Protein of unknown function (DUF664)
MTTTTEILIDAFGRIRDTAHHTLDGLGEAELTARLDPKANSIGWLVWHLARVQDDHVADLAGTEQRWTAGGWAERFDLPFDLNTVGYGQSSDDVAAVRGISATDLGNYLDEVQDATLDYVRDLEDDDFERVVDTSWDPPVTVAVRLVSVISDDLQHIGQAAFIRGVLQRTA